MNDNSKMISSPEPDDFLSDKLSYTRSWQQNQYLVDSGINSALETHAPSVSSKHGYDDMDSDYGVKPLKVEQTVKMGGASNDGFSNDMCMMTPDTPNSMQCFKNDLGSGGIGGGEMHGDASSALSVCDSMKKEDLASIKSASELDINIDKLEVESAMPDLVKLIKDEDDAVILNEATMMIFQLSKSDAIDALINSDEMISCIIEAIDKADHAEAVRFLAGVIYNMSQKKHGLKVIFEKNVIPCLVKLLGFTMESVLFYAITTLHNLLLYQEGGKEAVRLSGCIPKMVALLQKNNIKFLTICTDCLQILAFNHQPSKIEILKNGGPLHLIHIIKTYDYEKLLWTATRVIKVLSVCSANKPVIIREGGVEALTNILYHTIQKNSTLSSQSSSSNVNTSTASTNNNNTSSSDSQSDTQPSGSNSNNLTSSSSNSTSSAPQFSQRLLHNCLWTLRNLSDAASRLNFDNLLKVLTDILMNAANSFARQNYQIDTNAVTCAAGILSNLTCNNQYNKMTLYKIGGVEAILRTIEWNLVIMTSNNPAIRISNSYHPEEMLEPCICALRHVSSRHEQAELAQASIIQYQGLNVLIKLMEIQLGPDLYHMQTHQSVLPNLFVSYYNINWNLIKAIIGLIRNLGMSPCNFLAIREKGFVWPMIVLINRAQIDIYNKVSCGSISQKEKLLEEIIEVACGALHMLAKDPGIRTQILSIKLWQRLINSPQQIGVQPAVYVIANLILNYSESVQRVAVGLLVEVSAERYGLELIMNQPFITGRLNEMVHSNNEALSTYASAILIRVTEEKNKRYNGSGNFLPSPVGSGRPMMPQSANMNGGNGGSVGINNGSGSGGYLSSMLSPSGMHCGMPASSATLPSNSNMVGISSNSRMTNMSPSNTMLLTNELMHDITEMDVSDFPMNGPPSVPSVAINPRYCSPTGGAMYMESMDLHGGPPPPTEYVMRQPQYKQTPNSKQMPTSNYPPNNSYKPNMLMRQQHQQGSMSTKENSGGGGGGTNNTAGAMMTSQSQNMDICMNNSTAETEWMEGWSPNLDPNSK